MVAYVLWEHGAGGSNPFTPTKPTLSWLRGQAVKTPPFHGGNRGSIPLGVTIFNIKVPLVSGPLAQLVRAVGS